MRDEDDALAVAGQIPDDLHEFIDLLRRQRSGRLVENQRLCAAVEHLQNLHALLHSDRDILNFGVRVDLHAVALREFNDPLSRRLLIDDDAARRFYAENDVVRDCERLNQHEMLVHHADPQFDGVPRSVQVDLLPVDEDLAARRLVQTVEHIHQRALAGAVLSQNGVNLALVDREIDVIVCREIAELLDDILHLDDHGVLIDVTRMIQRRFLPASLFCIVPHHAAFAAPGASAPMMSSESAGACKIPPLPHYISTIS